MRRSIGVTILAVLFIIDGIFQLHRVFWGIQQLRPEIISRVEAGFNQMLTEQNVPPDEAEQKRQLFHQRLMELKSEQERRGKSVIVIGLSLATLAAGVGLLTMQLWARTLVQWVAGVSLAVVCWSAFTFFTRREPQAVDIAQLMLSAAGREAQAARAQAMVRQLAMATYPVVIAWNVFLLWFFQRPTVKAQFQTARSQ